MVKFTSSACAAAVMAHRQGKRELLGRIRGIKHVLCKAAKGTPASPAIVAANMTQQELVERKVR